MATFPGLSAMPHHLVGQGLDVVSTAAVHARSCNDAAQGARPDYSHQDSDVKTRVLLASALRRPAQNAAYRLGGSFVRD